MQLGRLAVQLLDLPGQLLGQLVHHGLGPQRRQVTQHLLGPLHRIALLLVDVGCFDSLVPGHTEGQEAQHRALYEQDPLLGRPLTGLELLTTLLVAVDGRPQEALALGVRVISCGPRMAGYFAG